MIGTGAARAASIRAEASRIVSFIATMPGVAHAPAVTAVVRRIMLDTGGDMMVNGELWEVRTRPLGGGVSRVTLARSLAERG